jgi:hypothetical protein
MGEEMVTLGRNREVPMEPRETLAGEAPEIVYRSAPVFRAEHGESRMTRLVEQQAAKMPSVLFLAAALAAMSASLLLELAGRHRAGQFVGMWPGPLLTMGVYNKLVKTFGAR